jgi:hypothetical protein
MSVSRPPARTAAIPASMACLVASDSSVSSARGVPTWTVMAESPCQPSRMAPQSTEIRSPSASTCCSLGMPWTICSFTDAQMVAGKSW